jgi:hypothetical protein
VRPADVPDAPTHASLVAARDAATSAVEPAEDTSESPVYEEGRLEADEEINA